MTFKFQWCGAGEKSHRSVLGLNGRVLAAETTGMLKDVKGKRCLSSSDWRSVCQSLFYWEETAMGLTSTALLSSRLASVVTEA